MQPLIGSFCCAGRVLYNWRVFPISLEGPPVAAFISPSAQSTSSKRDAYQTGEQPSQMAEKKSKATRRHAAGQLSSLEKEEDPLVEGVSASVGRPQAQAQRCRAWPSNGGLSRGPETLRSGCVLHPAMPTFQCDRVATLATLQHTHE